MLNQWPPAYLEGEPELLRDVLERNELAGRSSHYTQLLEQQWRHHTGATCALATVSGTAALTLAVRALEAEHGDEVIVPAFTFVASALAVMHAGLVPRFCDVDPYNYCIDLTSAETVVNERTRAIMVVHLNGVPADMSAAMQFAAKYNLAVIEDACQAHGAHWKNEPIGALGFAGAFSFNQTKTIPAGEGGVFVTNSKGAYRTALVAYQFGESACTPDQERSYHSTQVGWMFRPTEFVTALAANRGRYLTNWVARRESNHRTLSSMLHDIENISIQQIPMSARPAFWRYAFVVNNDAADWAARPRLLTALRTAGIRASQWQTRVLPDHEVFTRGYGDGCPWSCHNRPVPAHVDVPHARALARNLIWLEDAIAPTNGERELVRVAEVIRKLT